MRESICKRLVWFIPVMICFVSQAFAEKLEDYRLPLESFVELGQTRQLTTDTSQYSIGWPLLNECSVSRYKTTNGSFSLLIITNALFNQSSTYSVDDPSSLDTRARYTPDLALQGRPSLMFGGHFITGFSMGFRYWPSDLPLKDGPISTIVQDYGDSSDLEGKVQIRFESPGTVVSVHEVHHKDSSVKTCKVSYIETDENLLEVTRVVMTESENIPINQSCENQPVLYKFVCGKTHLLF